MFLPSPFLLAFNKCLQDIYHDAIDPGARPKAEPNLGPQAPCFVERDVENSLCNMSGVYENCEEK